jgi:hypothetical protein
MPSSTTLNSPRYRIVLGDWSDPDTWQPHEIQTIGRDMQMAETLFARHKQWGKVGDAPIRFQQVIAFYAMKRTGAYAGTFDQFEAAVLEVLEADDPDGEGEAVPTLPGPETA